MLAMPNKSFAEGETKEYMVQEIRVLNSSAVMNEEKNLIVTRTTKSVGKEGIPSVIRIGDKIKVKGRELTAKFIYVTEALKTMKYGKMVLMKKGEVNCVIVESPENLPYGDEWANRLWINVKDCKPIKVAQKSSDNRGIDGYQSPVLILPLLEWPGEDGSASAELAYFHGVWETYGFIMYGAWPRIAKAEQSFSDYRQCAEENKDRRWTFTGWLFATALKSSAAAQLVRNLIPLVCQHFAGKGHGGWQPPRIVDKKTWLNYSDIERKFYVAAFMETGVELMVLGQKPEDVARMVRCVKAGGVEKVLKALRNIKVKWQHPMPWTVAEAVGQTCKN